MFKPGDIVLHNYNLNTPDRIRFVEYVQDDHMRVHYLYPSSTNPTRLTDKIDHILITDIFQEPDFEERQEDYV